MTALLSTGCAAIKAFTSSDGEPKYSTDAEINMKKGEDALDSKNYTEAARYFDYVRTKYPYLEISKDAELRLADTDFEHEQYPESRDRYRAFIRLHPTHAKVDYAAFRAALSHYKDMPSQLFFLPPAEEKDQADVKAALASMNDFVRTFPNSSHLDEAKTVIDEVRRRLAEHELYVARFYARRQKWVAVIGRLNVVVQDFSGLGFDENAYYDIYDAYLKLNEPEKARETLKRIVERLPNTDAATRATKLLGQSG
jgi:outer membrane protein assembly factor BamD